MKVISCQSMRLSKENKIHLKSLHLMEVSDLPHKGSSQKIDYLLKNLIFERASIVFISK